MNKVPHLTGPQAKGARQPLRETGSRFTGNAATHQNKSPRQVAAKKSADGKLNALGEPWNVKDEMLERGYEHARLKDYARQIEAAKAKKGK